MKNHTIDVSAKVNLHDVVVLKDCLVPSIGSVVSGDMVQRASGGESNAGLESILFNQSPGPVLDHLTNVNHGHAWLDVLLGVASNLTVHLGGLSDPIVLVKLEPLQASQFLRGGAVGVVVLVLMELALWIDARREELGDRGSGRLGLTWNVQFPLNVSWRDSFK
jgi:hypothetical protein